MRAARLSGRGIRGDAGRRQRYAFDVHQERRLVARYYLARRGGGDGQLQCHSLGKSIVAPEPVEAWLAEILRVVVTLGYGRT